MRLRAFLALSFLVAGCASCGSSPGLSRPALATASSSPAPDAELPTSGQPTSYTAPPIADSAYPDRIWYPGLDALAAAVDDITVATVENVSPLQPIQLPGDTSPSGLSARTVTLAVEQNILHPADKANVTVYDGVLGERADRNPLSQGQRVLAFLARVRESSSAVTHGMTDYLVIDGTGTLIAPTPALSKGRGASFLVRGHVKVLAGGQEKSSGWAGR